LIRDSLTIKTSGQYEGQQMLSSVSSKITTRFLITIYSPAEAGNYKTYSVTFETVSQISETGTSQVKFSGIIS